MPLKGDLKEFGVPEIFQLLEQQGKTGCLRIRTDLRAIEIFFREGRIVGAFPEGADPWEYLVNLLFRLDCLSEEDLRRLEAREADELRSLKEILLGESLLGPREMEILLREHIEEMIYPLFQARKGEFSFLQERRLPEDWELKEPLAAEPLVLEGLRKTDEWPLLKKKIGSFLEIPERRVAMARGPAASWKERFLGLFGWSRGGEEGGGGEGGEAPFLEGEPPLSSAEKIVYGLIDGRRNIGEIIEASSLGEFSACQAFLSLLERGWILFSVPGGRPAERRGLAGGGRERDWPNRLYGGVAVAGLLVVLVLSQILARGAGEHPWGDAPFVRGEAAVFRLLNHAKRERVLEALELYRKEKGACPEALEALVKDRLLRPGDLSLWGPNRFSYDPGRDGDCGILITPRP